MMFVVAAAVVEAAVMATEAAMRIAKYVRWAARRTCPRRLLVGPAAGCATAAGADDMGIPAPYHNVTLVSLGGKLPNSGDSPKTPGSSGELF